MASFTITTTAIQDAAVTDDTAWYNAQQLSINPSWINLTPMQYAKQIILGGAIDLLMRRVKDRNSTIKASSYQILSDIAASGDATAVADKTSADAILSKYQ